MSDIVKVKFLNFKKIKRRAIKTPTVFYNILSAPLHTCAFLYAYTQRERQWGRIKYKINSLKELRLGRENYKTLLKKIL